MLSLTSTMAARKASSNSVPAWAQRRNDFCSYDPNRWKLCSTLAERGPDTTASVPRGNDGYGSLTATGLTTLNGGVYTQASATTSA